MQQPHEWMPATLLRYALETQGVILLEWARNRVWLFCEPALCRNEIIYNVESLANTRC